MRVALCFYGTLGGTSGKAGDKNGRQLEVLNIAYPYYKKRILDVNDSVDVFIHSWDTDIEKEVDSKYKFTKKIFENQVSWENIPPHLTDTTRLQHHISRWYSCQEVIKLKKLHESENNFEYDFVLLTRQDLAWMVDFNFLNYNNKYLYLGNWFNQNTGEPMGYPNGNFNRSLNDSWILANSNHINELVEIFDNILEYTLENKELTAYKGISHHRLLYYKLCKMGIIRSDDIDKLKFIFKYGPPNNSDMPLIRWVHFGDNT
jgi:hypothetical protein